jgi:tetratricopeptide (TPR) repeat protein
MTEPDRSRMRPGTMARRRARGVAACAAPAWLALAAAAVWLGSHARGAADDLAGMDAVQAYRRATELTERHHAAESLPCFRRALELRPDVWQIRCDYAAALVNAAGEARPGPGRALGVNRSSWERAGLMHAALAELDRAERLAPAPADRAVVVGVRAQTLALWGMGWNGLAEYRRALELEPDSEILRARSNQLERMLHDPQ